MEIESSLIPAVKMVTFQLLWDRQRWRTRVRNTFWTEGDCSGFIYCQRVRYACTVAFAVVCEWVIWQWRLFQCEGACVLLQCGFSTPRLPLLCKLAVGRAKTGADDRRKVVSQKSSFYSRRCSTKHRSSQNPISTGPNDGNQSAPSL